MRDIWVMLHCKLQLKQMRVTIIQKVILLTQGQPVPHPNISEEGMNVPDLCFNPNPRVFHAARSPIALIHNLCSPCAGSVEQLCQQHAC